MPSYRSQQADLRRHDPHLQLRGPRRPGQPGQDHHHLGEQRVRGAGPVPYQHEVGGEGAERMLAENPSPVLHTIYIYTFASLFYVVLTPQQVGRLAVKKEI